MDWKHKPLPGTRPRHVEGSVPCGKPEKHERIRVTLIIKPDPSRTGGDLGDRVQRLESALPKHREHLTHQELEAHHAPHENHVDLVKRFARDHRLDVVEISKARHDVVLEGAASDINRAFSIELEHFEHAGGRYRAHSEQIHVPEELHDAVIGVLGLDDLPLHGRPSAASSGTNDRSYSPDEFAHFYNFPEGTGAGQRVAILEFGGGYHASDLRAFFDGLGLAHPNMSEFSVDGAENAPLDLPTLQQFVSDLNKPQTTISDLQQDYGSDFGVALATLETTLDIEIAGAIVPGAHIDVYLSTPHARGIYHAIYAALGQAENDCRLVKTIGAEPDRTKPPTVMSISWGLSEAHWNETGMLAIHAALEAAKNLGVTVCCSSGDYGSYNSPPNPSGFDQATAHVNFPASSPYSLACGGTRLEVTADGGTRETVWNNDKTFGTTMASGGGVSGWFKRPGYQAGSGVPQPSGTWLSRHVENQAGFQGRGLPDVAASSDYVGGYRILVGGQTTTCGGTSAATPLWAALIARLSESLGHRVGWLTPMLYRPGFETALREVTEGNNDVSGGRVTSFKAGKGWDACAGWGSPDGKALFKALSGS